MMVLTVFDMSTIKTLLLTDLSGTYVAQDPSDFDFEFSVAGSSYCFRQVITRQQQEIKLM